MATRKVRITPVQQRILDPLLETSLDLLTVVNIAIPEDESVTPSEFLPALEDAIAGLWHAGYITGIGMEDWAAWSASAKSSRQQPRPDLRRYIEPDDVAGLFTSPLPYGQYPDLKLQARALREVFGRETSE